MLQISRLPVYVLVQLVTCYFIESLYLYTLYVPINYPNYFLFLTWYEKLWTFHTPTDHTYIAWVWRMSYSQGPWRDTNWGYWYVMVKEFSASHIFCINKWLYWVPLCLNSSKCFCSLSPDPSQNNIKQFYTFFQHISIYSVWACEHSYQSLFYYTPTLCDYLSSVLWPIDSAYCPVIFSLLSELSTNSRLSLWNRLKYVSLCWIVLCGSWTSVPQAIW